MALVYQHRQWWPYIDVKHHFKVFVAIIDFEFIFAGHMTLYEMADKTLFVPATFEEVLIFTNIFMFSRHLPVEIPFTCCPDVS